MRCALLVSADVPWALELARAWSENGDTVTVVLLDGATAVTRTSHALARDVEATLAAGVEVHAHDEALVRRGIGREAVLDGIKQTDLDAVADLIVEGADKVVWL